MYFRKILYFISFLILLSGSKVSGQAIGRPVSPGANQVEIIKADSLVGLNQAFMEVRKLMGNVSLRQGSTLLYCDLAILNSTTNNLEAYGKVKILQADTVTITGDTAFYFGNDRKALINGRVKLDDKTILLTTKKLDYDLNSRMAVYNTGGKIIDKKSTLTSVEGHYNTVSKIFLFKKNVKVFDKDGTLSADSLRYSTATKEAFFISPTEIVNKKDTMYANAGMYNTVTKLSNFTGRSTAKMEDYVLTADTLFYDTPTKIGISKGNVVFVSRKDKVILTGNQGRYYGQTGITRVYGNALMKNILENDTLFLTGDTLVSLDNKETKVRKMYAYKKVLIYKSDLAGKCDSLSYNVSDSTIYFYQKPILWSAGNQSEADSINILLVHNKINLMNMKGKSFVISLDTLKNFNQVKGRKIVANFTSESKLEKVTVDGNGESIYFAVDEKNKLTGMNRVECSKMNIAFKKNKVNRIAFIAKPDAKFVPPKEINEDLKQLDGFKWRLTEKPTKQTILDRVTPPEIVKKVLTDSILVKKEIVPVKKQSPSVPKSKSVKKKPLKL